MLKLVTAGATALFVTASPLAYAQAPSTGAAERLNVADWNKLTDLRIDLVKAALQLTPEQAKYWPAIEDAIRARAKNRQARLAKIAETVGKRSDESPFEMMRNRDPVAFLNRRADALAQRSADLKKLADAWQPLYKTLTPEQKQRMAALTILVLRDMGLRVQSEDDED
jgi:Spy/CpxP family protein refolding chaperone